ncbi:MAG: thiol-disulfide oxidoreductase DCC family protein, partial [Candidatus Methylomirabilis sp.]
RAARWTMVPGMFLIQTGILILMGPDFSHFLVCYLFWVPWDRVGLRLVAWLGGRRKHVLLFDGACGLCQRTVAVIRRLDLMGRLEYYDAWNDWPAIATRFPRLKQASCLQEMQVIMPNEQVLTRFDAYRAMARVVPLGWLALPLLYLPGVRAIGRRIYAGVASRRHGGACPLPPGGSAPEAHLDHNTHTGPGPLKDG